MRIKSAVAAAVSIVTLLSLASCGSGSAEKADGKVTLDFWHISTTKDGKAYWEDVARKFEAKNPNVTINVQPIQTEDYDGKLQTAMQDEASAPDVLFSRGGRN